MADHPSDNATSLVIGGEVKTIGLAVAGKLFVFTPHQMQFLLNLQKMKSVHAAAMSVNKDEEWAKKFLSSRKFKSYISNKLQEYSVKSGMTVDWWHQFGKWVADGYKESYRVRCDYCKYDDEPRRNRDEGVEATPERRYGT